MNIILCGMAGCGKTTYGKRAAEKFHLPFVDSDDLVQAAFEKSTGVKASCREIALKKGNCYFRSLEADVIEKLAHTRKTLIAIGGGTLEREENVKILKAIGKLLYLQTAPERLLRRLLARDPLPSYINRDAVESSFHELLKTRIPLYEQHADCVIDMQMENPLETIYNYFHREAIDGK